MKKKPSKKIQTLQERAVAYINDEKAALERHGLSKLIVVTFPNKQKPPFLGFIALKLLKWSGGVADIQISEKQ